MQLILEIDAAVDIKTKMSDVNIDTVPASNGIPDQIKIDDLSKLNGITKTVTKDTDELATEKDPKNDEKRLDNSILDALESELAGITEDNDSKTSKDDHSENSEIGTTEDLEKMLFEDDDNIAESQIEKSSDENNSETSVVKDQTIIKLTKASKEGQDEDLKIETTEDSTEHEDILTENPSQMETSTDDNNTEMSLVKDQTIEEVMKTSKEGQDVDFNIDTTEDSTEKLIFEDDDNVTETLGQIETSIDHNNSKLSLVKNHTIEEVTKTSKIQDEDHKIDTPEDPPLKEENIQETSSQTETSIDEKKSELPLVKEQITDLPADSSETKSSDIEMNSNSDITETKSVETSNKGKSTNDSEISEVNGGSNGDESNTTLKDIEMDTTVSNNGEENTEGSKELVQISSSDEQVIEAPVSIIKVYQESSENDVQEQEMIKTDAEILATNKPGDYDNDVSLEETLIADTKSDDIIASLDDDKVSSEKTNHETISETGISQDSTRPIDTLLNGTIDIDEVMEIKDKKSKADIHLSKDDVMEIDDENPTDDQNDIKNHKNSVGTESIEKDTIENIPASDCDPGNYSSDDCVEVKETSKVAPENKENSDTSEVAPANDDDKESSDDCVEVKETLDEVPVAKVKESKTQDAVQNDEKQSGQTHNAEESNKKEKKTFSGLSNTLDILSDDEEEEQQKKDNVKTNTVCSTDNKCINIEDDDDIMLIDEDSSTKPEASIEIKTELKQVEEIDTNIEPKVITESNENKISVNNTAHTIQQETNEAKIGDITTIDDIVLEAEKSNVDEKTEESIKIDPPKPIIPKNFINSFKKNMSEMTREDLEEFCLIKIVEGVIDRSNLSEVKTKLKVMAQTIEEWKKKTMMITKQNRDLQIVLKTVQEEQKQKPDAPIAPLKITRSVGMQVYMHDHNERGVKRKSATAPNTRTNKQPANSSPKTLPSKPNTVPIPVPRLVPASNNSPVKNIRASPQVQSSTVSSNSGKVSSPSQSETKNSTQAKSAEKRPFSSVTVDLTDDEPPAKQTAPARNANQPVRLVNPNQLMAHRPQTSNQQNNTGPRKVYIPINQNQNIRPGQTFMLKTVSPTQGPRMRATNGSVIRLPNHMRLPRPPPQRHPAPLPDVTKQPQPPNWKALPPAPDLKISKVENGIVISWKIEGYQEDSYETVSSYQLYAYQETSSPPSTALWKKIGDVRALPLPMACTLTQFMAGYKYYFAVRAVDKRSRIGPFSLPGSILLLNK